MLVQCEFLLLQQVRLYELRYQFPLSHNVSCLVINNLCKKANMGFYPELSFTGVVTVTMCVLEVLSAISLQNETMHVETERHYVPLHISENSTVYDFNIPYLQKISAAVEKNHTQMVEKNIINQDSATISKTVKHKRRKKNGMKKRRKGLALKTKATQQAIPGNMETTTRVITTLRKRKRKGRRRKNRRKQKMENTNILEVTTAREMILSTNRSSNSTIHELIRKLNENPEDSFEDFSIRHANKTIIHGKSYGGNMANLVAPLPASAKFPIRLHDNITLHVSMSNRTNNKVPTRRNNRCRRNKGGCTHLCHPKGKTKCSCLEGFYLAQDQKTCLDVDECKINNGGCEMRCLNTLGSYECGCHIGLRLADNLKFCDDINECLLRNGHGPCQDTCENIYGSYKCSCKRLNGTKLGEDGRSCVDLDDCAENNGGCSHNCINTVGRAFCACPDGMELSSDWKTCQDINECEDDTIKKSCENGCVNTEGSYHCVNSLEYQNDESLSNKACKPLFPPPEGFISCSRGEAVLSYAKTGRTRTLNNPGTVCKLICPVGYKIIGQYHVICDFNGEWSGMKGAKCTRVPAPTIQCPPTQFVRTNQLSKTAFVKFPSPQTNVGWKYVKSYPSWGKQLSGTLKEGHYDIHFIVKDPTSKLSATCSVKIIVEN